MKRAIRLREYRREILNIFNKTGSNIDEIVSNNVTIPGDNSLRKFLARRVIRNIEHEIWCRYFHNLTT